MGLRKLSIYLVIVSFCICSTSVSAAELWSNQLWTEPWITQPTGDNDPQQETFTWCNSPLWSYECGSTNESSTSWDDEWWFSETPAVSAPKGNTPKTDLWSESFWSNPPVIDQPVDKPTPVKPTPPKPAPVKPEPITDPKPITDPEPIVDPIPIPPAPVIPEPDQITPVITMQIGNNKAMVRGIEQELSVPPYIVNGRTMVPLRFIGEAFAATFDWSANERKISMKLGGNSLQLWVNQSTALVNGQEVALDAQPMIINGAALVPLRFISEHLGYKAEFEPSTQRITISETTSVDVLPDLGNEQADVTVPEVPEPPKPTPPPALSHDYFGMWNLLTDWYTSGIPMGYLIVNEDGSYYLTNGINNEASGTWRVANKDEVIGIKEALILENALDGVDWALIPNQQGLSVRYQHGYSGASKVWMVYSLGVKINN